MPYSYWQWQTKIGCHFNSVFIGTNSLKAHLFVKFYLTRITVIIFQLPFITIFSVFREIDQLDTKTHILSMNLSILSDSAAAIWSLKITVDCPAPAPCLPESAAGGSSAVWWLGADVLSALEEGERDWITRKVSSNVSGWWLECKELC